MTHHDSARPTTLVPRRDPRPALLAAAIVAGVALLQRLASLAQSLVWLGDQDYLVGVVLPFVNGVLVDVVAFSAGVFLLLWLLPARQGDRVLVVLGKGLAAAAAGVLLSTVVSFVVALVSTGIWSLGDVRYYGGFNPFASLVPELLASAPLVMLVVLALWVVRRVPRS
ncbi:hypothetical protein [Protaetiibacter intestinalis]|uniref:Uncharacterized protein n=1 Tax=Protaetiibacter intestinalis TaxID=2419774 RepID=A0A387B768_9MICO|nr:hypothetical protein [Protaetiibacter intestinalis]AYF96959.1 hypothetical protein D7I47_00940 [Protaetiibacter intestinalis]